ncbi:MATE family efflux transporter [Photobacterium nomapromontoriensis]|uniref:MATE family efflux transporter n=1 Tax=Photobacterium nomapromontoriensis TaxID=2910237 RepID=UPI003D0D1B68
MSLLLRLRTQLDTTKTLLALALPIALQTAMFSSKSTVDTLMMGALSEYDIAAIGLAAKIQLIITFFIIGLSIGGGQIAAQCFGLKGVQGSRKLASCILVTLLLSGITATVFAIVLIFFPSQLMGLGSQSAEIIERGADYLQIIAISLFCFAYASSIAAGLRAMHQPGIATQISAVGVVLNLLLNWVFIFGHLGMPALGIKGAALGTAISAIIECMVLFLYLHHKGHLLGKFTRQHFANLHITDIKLVARLSATAAVNSVVWAAGLFAFHAILGYSDPNLLISLSVLAPLEALAMSLLIGLATAGSVIVGNIVGANKHQQLTTVIPHQLILSVITGIITATLLWQVKYQVLSVFFHTDTPSAAQLLAVSLYDIMAFSLVIKSLSMMLIVGILRAGGDATFCLCTDILAQWVFLLPCAYWMAHIAAFDAIYLYGLVLFEESAKIIVCLWRLKAGRWVKNLATAMQ